MIFINNFDLNSQKQTFSLKPFWFLIKARQVTTDVLADTQYLIYYISEHPRLGLESLLAQEHWESVEMAYVTEHDCMASNIPSAHCINKI